MKLVVFGLSLSSSWGNGHATLWRGLCRALAAAGHRVIFFERDVPYYAAHRDLTELPGCALHLYPDWSAVRRLAERELAGADAAIVTSYCPDALPAGELLGDVPVGLRVFYDLDTPVTLEALREGRRVAYLGPRGLHDFDLVLSYTGGAALDQLRSRLGAARVVPLYGSVDPETHRTAAPADGYRADLSYLGTYAPDRQERLRRLFVEPARRRPDARFLLAGAQYPDTFPWTDNIWFVRHLPPAEHPAFYASSRLTLNVTRAAMALMGYCPSGRLFEAAACGAAILSDAWEGLDRFFEPGRELLVAETSDDALAALRRSAGDLRRLGRAARERALGEHTARHRAAELLRALEDAAAPADPARAAGV